MLQLQESSAHQTGPNSKSIAFLERLAEARWFAYGSILLLQLKLMWGIWNFKDLTPDDTAYYFTAAYDWYRNLQTLFTWSPLYTAYYGSFLHISPDAYFATIAHRLVIVFALAVLVLYLMRRFLPPGIAWLMTAWWVVLPIDFDSKYEVHLFSVLPLVALVLLAAWKSTWARPAALAALAGTTILLRNEYFIATVLFAIALLAYEVRRLRRETKFEVRRTVARYVLWWLPVVVLTSFFLLRASDASKLRAMESDKHTLNWCQVFSYGYEQRHQDFTGSPWSECHELMKRTFDATQPSMVDSLRRNPAAILEHFAWNVSLIPNGIELLLFNVIGGSVTPDYNAVPVRPALAFSLVTALLSVITLGVWVMNRERERWREVLGPHVWAWIAIACMGVVAVFVMITQRPRPSYLLALGIFIRLACGMALWAIARRWTMPSAARYAIPIVAAVVILAVPPFYEPGPRNRPLLRAYRRLQPFEQQLQARPVHLITRGWGQELCNYVVAGATACSASLYSDVRADADRIGSFTEAVDARQANTFYIDDGIFAEKPIQQILAAAPANGWKEVGSGQIDDNRWALLTRAVQPQAIREIVQPGTGISIGRGWYPYERYQGAAFRWVNNDAEINFDRAMALPAVSLDMEPGPGVASGKMSLDVLDGSGSSLGQFSIASRQTITIGNIGAPAGNQIRLHIEGGGKQSPGDPRTLNFRVFHITSGAPIVTTQPAANAPQAAAPDIVSPADGIRIGQGWYPFEVYGGQQFRWIDKEAELILDSAAGAASLALDLEAGPGAAGKPLRVSFMNETGASVAAADVSRRKTLEIRLPLSPSSQSRYRIHIDGGGAPIPGDPRILNVRVFRIRRSPSG